MTAPLLAMDDVFGGYGGADVLQGVTLGVGASEIAVILGPNGAGKSTLMKAAFGLIAIGRGRVSFDGTDITNTRPDRVMRLGLSYVPQENNVFPSLSAQENLEMGAYLGKGDLARALERVFEIFPRIKERRRQAAGSMSGGERQMVAIGRALMMEPRLLLLDEPTAGLSPAFVEQTFERIVAINRLGVGVLMVEQNARQALAVASHGLILTTGRIRHRATAAALLADDSVAGMFLGA